MEVMYNVDACSKILAAHDTLREDQYLEGIFGVSSRLENKEWFDRQTDKKNTWIFEAQEIRKRLLAAAKID